MSEGKCEEEKMPHDYYILDVEKRRYVCILCGREYKTECGAYRHLRNVHDLFWGES